MFILAAHLAVGYKRYMPIGLISRGKSRLVELEAVRLILTDMFAFTGLQQYPVVMQYEVSA